MRHKVHLGIFLLPILFLLGCGNQRDAGVQRSSVIIAVEGDIDSFNPLFAEEVSAGEINDLLFPGLVGSDFDASRGELIYTPLLARSWEYQNRNRDIVFHLRTGAKWSDGQPITARDVQLSYELYGDPEVASIRQAAIEGLRLTNGKIDITKSVEVLNDSTVVFHFEQPYPGQLFDAGLPIIPAHVFEIVARKDLRTHPINKNPIVSGPFVLERWTPLQEVVLASNENCSVPHPAKVSKLVFRVLPDYRSRVSQLLSGEVDIVGGLRMEDADLVMKQSPSVEIISTHGRDYDFLGWNNIDPKVFEDSDGKTIKPHPMFGKARVRRALTMAINREEIVTAYLGKHGQQAIGGVSPLFKWAYNSTMKPLPYDKQQALTLLENEGWKDTDGNGILDRQGQEFAFTLRVPSGNQLRSVVATVVQQQLRDVKIDMEVEQVERGTFWENMMGRKYDAWFAGFSVPLQMQLDDLWGSDLEKYPFNLTGFRNKRIDEILAAARKLTNESEGAPLWKEFQAIIHEEQPCTFLFWINNIVGVSKRVGGTSIGVLGITHKAWEWSLQEGKGGVAARLW